MAPPDPQEIHFLDDDGNELAADELDTGEARSDRVVRRYAVLERWVPDGSGGAIAGLVFALVAWLGTQPIVTAVSAVLPQGQHRIGALTEESLNTGATTSYYGLTPGLIPVITYGVPAAFALLALLLGRRARRQEHSALASAAVVVGAVSVGLFVAAGVAVEIGISLGHSTNGFYF